MRYYSYNEYDENGGHVVTKSEDEIRAEYYPYWRTKMIEKFGKAHFDITYCFEDCLDDWKIINWAWEV